jgi:hypothetical protein
VTRPPLFDFNSSQERWTPDGERWGKTASDLLQPFVTKMVKRNYSVRQIEMLLKYEVERVCGIAILHRASADFRKKK